MYKVILWATGYVGTIALRVIIQDPDLELVGVRVYSPDKAGKDAGEIAGVAPTGIIATTDRDELLALDADVVLHCAQGVLHSETNEADVLALLRSGKNVISVASYHSLTALGADHAAPFESACREGHATLMGSGINPEFMEWLAPSMTRMCEDVTHVTITEIDDLAVLANASMMVELGGVGLMPDEFGGDVSPDAMAYIMTLLMEAVHIMGRYFGAEVEPGDLVFEQYTATKDLNIALGEVKKGTLCGGRVAMDGLVDGAPLVRYELIWTVESDAPDFPEIPGDTRYVIEVEGSPSIRTTIDLAPSLDPGAQLSGDEAQSVMVGTAMCAIRAIPAVCDAAPGLFNFPVVGGWTVRNRTVASLIP